MRYFERWEKILFIICLLFSVRTVWVMFFQSFYNNEVDRLFFWVTVSVCVLLVVSFISLRVTEIAIEEMHQEISKLRRDIRDIKERY